MNLLWVLLGICVGLLALEYGLRLIEKHSPFLVGISQLEVIAKENKRWWGMATLEKGAAKESPHYVISRNPKLFYEPTQWFYGFQERLRRDPDARKIVVLGDSTTRLFPTNEHDTDYYAHKLEERLNRDRAGKYLVINSGIPGYSTAQEVEFFEKKLLPDRPDYLVVGYCLNDKMVKHRIIKKQGYYMCSDLVSRVPCCSEAPFFQELYLHSELYKLFHYATVQLCYMFNRPMKYADLGADITEKALEKLKQLTRAHKIKVVFVVFPAFEEKEGGEQERLWITNKLQKVGFDFIDMKKAFDAQGQHPVRLAKGDPYHFNTAGHDLVAGELAEYFRRKLLSDERDAN